MHVSRTFLWSLMAGAVILNGTTSCRKPDEAVKSDLEEAGYQLTTADWFRATRGNDVPALKKFVAGGFDPETKDETGDSALHAAAGAGASAAADFLLDRGLALELRGASDRTPLMSAVLGDQTTNVRWLLRQGANPRAKDNEGYMPLMLAVREGKSGSVAELAPYSRDTLDAAILIAALVGRADSIDMLTNYGASVYARMEDGRTPLMIAAENGHLEAVNLLLDIGASRFSIDASGKSAADLATAAGHTEIAAIISREPLPEELALETPAAIAKSMDAFVDAAIAKSPPVTAPPSPGSDASVASASPEETSIASAASATGQNSPPPVANPMPGPSRPIQGETLSASLSNTASSDSALTTGAQSRSSIPTPETSASPVSKPESFKLPPLVMRLYREREVPVQVRTVDGDTATLAVVSASGTAGREVKVRQGESLPGSSLKVVRVQRRMEDSKLNLGHPMEVSVVEVQDTLSQTSREWISGVPSNAHDPIALVEDAATGQRYTASPGQRFKSADGSEFIISDVRPSQMVIEDVTTGAVQTIPLRGPRG